MTEEELKFEFDQAEAFFGEGNKNAGYLVETKSGLTGRTYHKDDPINGKQIVYTEHGNLLCDPKTLTVIGFVD